MRLGGEEFALVLPGADAATAFLVAERIRHTTRAHFSELGHGLTVSIGVTAGEGEQTPSKLLREAGRALYTATRSGRDRTVLHHRRQAAPAPARRPQPRLRRSRSADPPAATRIPSWSARGCCRPPGARVPSLGT